LLECLAERPNATMEELCEMLDIQRGGVISKYLHDLCSAGFVMCSHTWDLALSKISKLKQYRISDNYFRFYLKYIEPNRESILRGAFNERSLQTVAGWETIMGLQFENLVIHNRAILYNLLKIHLSDILNDGPYFQKPSKQRQGCQ